MSAKVLSKGALIKKQFKVEMSFNFEKDDAFSNP